MGDVQDSQGVSASEMTYIVSSGALNSTHSLTSLFSYKKNLLFRMHFVAVVIIAVLQEDFVQSRCWLCGSLSALLRF